MSRKWVEVWVHDTNEQGGWMAAGIGTAGFYLEVEEDTLSHSLKQVEGAENQRLAEEMAKKLGAGKVARDW